MAIDPATRLRVLTELAQRSGGQLELFFASYGLGAAYTAPDKAWGKAKRIGEALTAAERRGDGDVVLEAAATHFDISLEVPSSPTVEAGQIGEVARGPSVLNAETGTSQSGREASPPESDPTVTGPSVFISYAHEDGDLVLRLADAMRVRGCRVWIDQGEMRVGDRLVDRIAGAIAEMDFLLAIISEASVQSPWCQRELSLAISGELETAHVKVLPVRLGTVAIPASLRGIYSPRVNAANASAMAETLMSDMTSHRTEWGAEGKPPARQPIETPTIVPAAPAIPPKAGAGEPIRILGIDVDNVSQPRDDGTRGSALYRVPLRLNRAPSPLWAITFATVWDRPPQFTTMHRPGIGRVSEDRIVLDGTTVEEVERYHAETLRHVIPEVNRQVEAVEAELGAKQERADLERRKHELSVRDAAKRVSFD